MDDHGETIVFLARELLESGVPDTFPVEKKKKVSVTLSFKTLCFTTILAATGGSLISTCVNEHIRPLNRYEKVELQALVFYTARLKKINEEILRHEVEAKTGVPFEDMTANEFPVARRFLQEKAQ